MSYEGFVERFDAIVARGFCKGVGERGSQVCVEAAVCEALGMPHGDEPTCVGAAVRSAKIRLNDSRWSSPEARAKGLRDVGIAQLGSDQLDQQEFAKRLAEKTIRVLIPALFRDVGKNNQDMLDAADACERKGTRESALKAQDAAAAASSSSYASYASYAASSSSYAAASSSSYASYAASSSSYASYAAYAADAAADAADASSASADHYLKLMAGIILEVLVEMKSPGVELLVVKPC